MPNQNVDRAVDKAVTERLAAAHNVWSDELTTIVNKKLEAVTKEMDKVRAVQAVQAQTNLKLSEVRREKGKNTTGLLRDTFEEKYWKCRSAVRIWPINCSSENTMWADVGTFFFDKLLKKED